MHHCISNSQFKSIKWNWHEYENKFNIIVWVTFNVTTLILGL
jgi:hypothetical protein